MKRKLALFSFALLALTALARPVCVGNMCYPSEEAARAAGALPPATNAVANPPSAAAAPGAGPVSIGRHRMTAGYMGADDFIAFLSGAASPTDSLASHPLWMVLLLVLLGGLAANLTPCVLPLVPVNLILVGRGWKRGAAYGAGIVCAYGALGLVAAFGSLAFGAMQSSPWFNLVAAVVFALLGLSMCGVFSLDFTRYRRRSPQPRKTGEAPRTRSHLGCFMLGAGAAALAGACVEPILLATLALTAKWCAAGQWWAVSLPFVLGAGLALPWPFAAAGLSVLPRPGVWMVWVNRVFAVVLFVASVYYALIAWRGFQSSGGSAGGSGAQEAKGNGGSRPRLYIVGAPWCRNCRAMERDVLALPKVREAMERYDVRRIEVDGFDELKTHPELRECEIRGVPAYVIFE